LLVAAGDLVQRCQPAELPVAAHPNRAGAFAQQLHGRHRRHELEVLHSHQRPGEALAGPGDRRDLAEVVAVLHAYRDLGGTDLRGAEH